MTVRSEVNHFSNTGLTLNAEEIKGLEASGWEFTGWYNEHGQPIVKNKVTGEELAYCRMGYALSATCLVCNAVQIPEFGEYYGNSIN